MLSGELTGLRARTAEDVETLHAELYEDVATRVRSDLRPWVPLPSGPASPFWVPGLGADPSEAAAIRRIFGADIPPVTAFKWAFGHTMAAAGAIDAVLALCCLRTRSIPGIATLREVDPRCLPLPIAAAGSAPRSDIALVLGRGFGGMSTALLIQAPPGGV